MQRLEYCFNFINKVFLVPYDIDLTSNHILVFNFSDTFPLKLLSKAREIERDFHFLTTTTTIDRILFSVQTFHENV